MSDENPDLASQIARQPETLVMSNVDAINLTEQKKIVDPQTARYLSDTLARQLLAGWAVVVVSVWLYSVLAVVKENNNVYCLSDTVIITLLGTTTLNVLGLSYIVLKGHFSVKDGTSDGDSTSRKRKPKAK